MTERELQQAVLDLARTHSWKAYHTFDSRRSEPGFPDLIAIRGERLLAIEFKSEKGKVTPEQSAWLDAFRDVWRVEAMVIRPAPTLDAVARLLA
jgi:Holliday junction resolvase